MEKETRGKPKSSGDWHHPWEKMLAAHFQLRSGSSVSLFLVKAYRGCLPASSAGSGKRSTTRTGRSKKSSVGRARVAAEDSPRKTREPSRRIF